VGEILYCLLIKIHILCYQPPYHNCLHATITLELVSPKLWFSAGDNDDLIGRRRIPLQQSPLVLDTYHIPGHVNLFSDRPSYFTLGTHNMAFGFNTLRPKCRGRIGCGLQISAIFNKVFRFFLQSLKKYVRDSNTNSAVRFTTSPGHQRERHTLAESVLTNFVVAVGWSALQLRIQ